MVCSIWKFGWLGSTDYLGINAEVSCDGDKVIGCAGFAIGLQSMPHVVDSMHFLVACAAGFSNGLKHSGSREEIVFQMFHPRAEAQTLGLAAS